MNNVPLLNIIILNFIHFLIQITIKLSNKKPPFLKFKFLNSSNELSFILSLVFFFSNEMICTIYIISINLYLIQIENIAP